MYTHQGLSRSQERALLEQALDVYQGHDASSRYPDDIAHEIVDGWLPVYYHNIREEWEKAGCPEPDEDITGDTAPGDIHALMNVALYGTAWGYLYRFVSEAETYGEVVEAIEEELGLTDQQRIDRAIKIIDQVLLGTDG